MNYTRLRIEANPEQQEILISLLSDYDAVGFEQADDHLLAYFPETDFKSYEINTVLKDRQVEITRAEEKNWNEEWESNFQPVIVDDFCGIRADFHTPLRDVLHEILITPKMSFGTGHHATTFMMMQQMRDLSFEGKTVLDFGTGTGVLAILAGKMGAAKIKAIDNDRWSFENAAENISKNNIANIDLIQTEDIPVENFDIILANINRNILQQYMPVLEQRLLKNGSLLLSGLMTVDEAFITEKAQDLHLHKEKLLEKDGWISLLFSK